MNRRAFLRTIAGASALAAVRARPARAVPMPDDFTVAAVGDCIPARRLAHRADPGIRAVIDLLRGADCTWGNCETVIADLDTVHPAYKEGDPHVIAPPWAADEMAAFGIGIMGTANNHTMDWGEEGLRQTLAHLDRVGLAHGGAGPDLAHAARPAYLDVMAGRFADINCATTFPDFFAASRRHPYVNGRPGINPLTLDRVVQVDQDLHAKLSALQRRFIELSGFGEFEAFIEERLAEIPEGLAFFGESMVKAGDGFDLLAKPRDTDVERLTEAVGIARNNARCVLASIHSHEARGALEVNDPFLQPFARGMIDAGADAFFAAGPHVVRGIEIHDGKPIFYGLGNFIFHLGGPPNPAETYEAWGLPPDTIDPSIFTKKIPYIEQPRFWQSFVPVVHYRGGSDPGGRPTLAAIDLHPLRLGFGEPTYRFGSPEPATGAEAREILERLQELSKPFGTEIVIEGDQGRVVVG